MIFDESTAMLDPVGRREVIETFEKLNREQGITVLTITHYMNEAARADRVIVIDDGKILADGTPREIFADPDKLKRAALDVPQCTSLVHGLRAEGVVLDGEPIATDRTAPHLGALIPGAVRRRLDEGFEDPRFCHFFCSEDTRHFAFDTFICEGEGDPKGREGMGQRIYCGYDDGSGKLRIKYLLNTYGLFLGEGSNHAHPILTPDNTGLLFNSTVTGQSQIYIIEGFEY